MKFGHTEHIEAPDMPSDAQASWYTEQLSGLPPEFTVYVGCPKWNRQDLKNFYPPGTKGELEYYATQFNSIELNATYHRIFPESQFLKWREAVPEGFKFFPKFGQDITGFRRMKDVEELVEANVRAFEHFQDKLGIPFLQLHNEFSPRHFDRLKKFIQDWEQYGMSLSIEFRHAEWFSDQAAFDEAFGLLRENGITAIMTDTPGRRDVLHMRPTTPVAFIRFVGCNNDEIDYKRLDDWVDIAARWKEKGIKVLAFFLHQHVERESPKLAAYFIEKLNGRIGTAIQVPILCIR